MTIIINRIAELILKHLRGESTEEENAELDEWIAASAENRQLFEYMTDEKGLTEELKKIDAQSIKCQEEEWKRIQHDIRAMPDKKNIKKMVWLKDMISAVVALIVFMGTGWLKKQQWKSRAGIKELFIRWVTVILYTVTVSDRTAKKDVYPATLIIKNKPPQQNNSDNIFVLNEIRKIDSVPGRNTYSRTLFSKAMPLILLNDSFYDGDIENINPNDVESVVMLQGAEAVIIAGPIGAGNGIIKIITKKSTL